MKNLVILKFKKIDKYIEALYPICFFTGSYVSLFLAFYGVMFFNSEKQRILFSGIVSAVIAVLVGIRFLILLEKGLKKNLSCFAIPVFFLLPFFIGFILYGLKKEIIWQLAQFILFGIPLFFIAFSIVIENKLKRFLMNFNWCSLAIMPFGIFYIVRFFSTTKLIQSYNDFGGMSYMTIAYVFFLIFVVAVINLFYIKQKLNNIFQFIFIIISWFVSLYSGTRGAIVSFFAFLAILFVFDWIFNRHIKCKQIILLSVFLLGTYFFSVNVWSPTSSGPGRRLQNFLYDVKIYEKDSEEEFDGSYSEDEKEPQTINLQKLYINYCIQNNKNIETSIKELQNNKTTDGKEIINFESKELEKKFKEYIFVIRRPALYQFAIQEFKKHPFRGNGALYFQNKYDVNTVDFSYSYYPHNLILELLCDFGLFGLLALIIVIVYILKRLFPLMSKDRNVFCITLLCFSQVVKYMFSGGAYLSYHTFFSICFGILCISKYDKQRRFSGDYL